MKKLLLLGGSSQQVKAITIAKEEGYYTILCDYLPDNPGQYEADKFYQVSTTDKEAVLEIALNENIDGIIAYSSDPAAPTAAYVCEKLGLPGVPRETADAFCNKNLFRVYLKENGFHVPGMVEVNSETVIDDLSHLTYPLIVKPTDSSGSKGVTVIQSPEEFPEAKKYALEYAHKGLAVAEEFIVRDHPDVIEAEIFVVNNKVAVWGLMNSIRDPYTNPLLPAAYSYPLNISEKRIQLVKDEVSRLVECSKVQNGAFNIEMIITKEEKLYFLDAGPRNGGNMLPEFISMICRQDLPKATIDAVMGKTDGLGVLSLDGKEGGFWGLSVLHTDQNGIFDKMAYSPLAEKYLLREHYFKEQGKRIRPFMKSVDAVGLAFFEFPDDNTMNAIMYNHGNEHIKVIVIEEEN